MAHNVARPDSDDDARPDTDTREGSMGGAEDKPAPLTGSALAKHLLALSAIDNHYEGHKENPTDRKDAGAANEAPALIGTGFGHNIEDRGGAECRMAPYESTLAKSENNIGDTIAPPVAEEPEDMDEDLEENPSWARFP
jgi:hypothetical protein